MVIEASTGRQQKNWDLRDIVDEEEKKRSDRRGEEQRRQQPVLASTLEGVVTVIMEWFSSEGFWVGIFYKILHFLIKRKDRLMQL